MTATDDMQLLQEYATSDSQTAFATLVERHIGLVYSTAMRRIGDPHRAEEITQAVFIILAQKAARLSSGTVLSGWLYRTTLFACADDVKKLQRRQRYEQEAFMESTLENSASDSRWNEIAPHLDEAMSQLGDQDRNALVLRFFENKPLHEVGLALGASEEAAKKRVSRAVEKLRGIFSKRGFALPAAILGAAISANSIQAAPIALTKTVATAALAKGAAASSSTLTLIKGTLKIMAWTKAKTGIVVGVGLLFAAGTATVAVKEIAAHRQAASQGKVSTASRTTPGTKSIKGQFIRLAELIDAGNGTPENAFETRYWQRANGDYDAVIASTNPKAVDGAKAWMGDKDTFRAKSKEELTSFVGMQFLARKDLADDRVELRYQYVFSDHRTDKIVEMVKINGAWFSGQTRAYDASWDAGSQPEPQR